MLQLLHMLDKWTEYLECGGQIDAAYADFESRKLLKLMKRLIPNELLVVLENMDVQLLFMCQLEQQLVIPFHSLFWC